MESKVCLTLDVDDDWSGEDTEALRECVTASVDHFGPVIDWDVEREYPETVACHQCDGTGTVREDGTERTCHACDGSGELPK